MRVLLVGATGRLGLRCIPAVLAHSHTLTVYVRDVPKLHSLLSPALVAQLHAIVEGDATDAEGIKKAIRDHDIEGIIDVCGNQVLPWREYLLPKIARAVTEAAIAVGKERGGKPLRAWVTAGMGCMEYPGLGGALVADFLPVSKGLDQHRATMLVVTPIPTSDLRWSLICVGWMRDANPEQGLFEPLQGPKHHTMLVEKTVMPAWERSWVESIPVVGRGVWTLICMLRNHQTFYEEVADVLAEDLEVGGEKWVGQKVSYILKEKIKEV